MRHRSLRHRTMRYRALRHRALLTATLLSLTACGSPDRQKDASALEVHNSDSGSWTTEYPDAVSFVLEQRFGADGDDLNSLLSWPYAITTDDAQNVYVLDYNTSRIVSFDKEGSYRWFSGSPGSGPGEIENPGRLIAHKDTLHLVNASASRIDRFTTSGQYTGSWSALSLGLQPRGARLIGFTSDDNPIFANQLSDLVGADIGVFDRRKDSITTRIRADVPELADAISPHLQQAVDVSGGLITTGYLTRYAHYYYDEAGTLVRAVTRDLPIVPPNITNESIANYSFVSAPQSIGSGFWVATASWPTNMGDPDQYYSLPRESRHRLDYANTIDLFDDTGKLLWSKVYQGDDRAPFTTIRHIDQAGRIYVVVDGHVQRFRVEIKRP